MVCKTIFIEHIESMTSTNKPLLKIANIILLLVNLVTVSSSSLSFTQYARIGEEFFETDPDNEHDEASGMDIAPDGSHLVAVSDSGNLFFLNLNDYTSGHCMVDLDYDSVVNGKVDRTDLEGVAIDPTKWKVDDKEVYVVFEGSDDDDEEPYLFKIKYEYEIDASGEATCSAYAVDAVSLLGAIPSLTTGNGIESLTYIETTDDDITVFYAGVQDTGKLYKITSEGNSYNDCCYEPYQGKDDLSALNYDGTYLWAFYGDRDEIVMMMDTENGLCTVETYDIPEADGWDKEGIVIDSTRNLMYMAVDETSDYPSIVAVYNMTYPDNPSCDSSTNIGRSCDASEVCRGASTTSSSPTQSSWRLFQLRQPQ